MGKHAQETMNEYAWEKLRNETGKETWDYAVLHVAGREPNVVKRGELFWYIKGDMLVLKPKNKVIPPWIPQQIVDQQKMQPTFKLEICIAQNQLISVEFFTESLIEELPKGGLVIAQA